MAAIILSDEIQTVANERARKQGFTDASEYISLLVQQDQLAWGDEELESLALEGLESGEPVEMTHESWRELRAEFHRQAGIR